MRPCIEERVNSAIVQVVWKALNVPLAKMQGVT